MDVITTTLAEKIVEKNIMNQKRCPRKRNKKHRNRMNQNVEISSKENCHGINEAGAYVSQGVDLEKSSQVDRAHAEEIAGKNKTHCRKLNEMKNFVNTTNQNIETSCNEECHVDEGNYYNGLAVESLLRGSSQEDIAPNDTIENKRASFKDELVVELSQGENFLRDAVKECSHNKTKKRKRKSKSKGLSNNKLEPMDIEKKCLEISVDNSCIAATELGIKDVKLTVEPVLQESAEVENVSTETVKEKQPERKKRSKKAKARNRDGKAILDEEDKCLKISVDSKSCIAAAESGIDGADSTVESMLQESLKIEEVSTEIAKENKIPEGKRRSKRKRKSKARKTDGNASLDGEVKCLKVSVDGESCISAADLGINGVDSTVGSLLTESPVVVETSTKIVQKQNTPNRKQRKKRKSKDRDIDEKAILGEEDKCTKISVESNGGIVAAESGINHVDSTLEPLPQELPKVEEDSTKIFLKQNTQEVKQKRKRKSKDRNKDEEVILGEEDKGLKISVESNSGIAAVESGINHVDSTFEPLPQELPKVVEVSTEIAKNQKTAAQKRRRKKKSKDKDKDEKVILREEDKCLKVSVESNSGIAAAESGIKGVNEIVESLLQDSTKVEEGSTKVAQKQNTSEEKQRRKRKSKDTDKNGKAILGEDDKCLQISADRKSCVAAAESTIKDVDSNVESLLQDSAVVDEASTDIVQEKKGTKRKSRQRRKLKIMSENKVEEPILEQQNQLLVTSIDGTCCTKIEMGTLQGVDSRSKCPSDNDCSLVSNGMVDLSNGLIHVPQRAGMTCSRRILLILDINGLLADIVMPPPKERKSDINMLGRAIFRRPYCDDFLNFCFDTFDVGIWSSRSKRVIDKVVDYLLGKRKQELLFCWDMSHTTVSKFKTLENRYKPLVCKSLRNVWEKRDPTLPWEKGDYTESNTLLIDDSPYKALLNPMHTAIFPYSYTYKDRHDNALGPGGKIRVYLENLAKTDDVRKYVEQHPFGQPAITEKSSSWDFYSNVVSSLSRF